MDNVLAAVLQAVKDNHGQVGYGQALKGTLDMASFLVENGIEYTIRGVLTSCIFTMIANGTHTPTPTSMKNHN